LFLYLHRIASEISNDELASKAVFGEISIVFHAESVNEIIASVTAEQGSVVECVSHELRIFKNDL